ncbi:extracellular solute-binding protein [Ornithinimicrobium ciconiae]|uniref:Extracellular solute-binding protein n=1 Tax=Ornithinimicrobium ciconiae TaxID=2594265 RepID=A0A516G8I7_9MICO|nr:extracellular solute-binding protein [Ornithinimicrobium ciconiae]QDO87841.1 extracellular solute-binding protein [Ornithinimicrobium ciconiae]
MSRQRSRSRVALALCAASVLVGLTACGGSEDNTRLTWYINPDGGGSNPEGGGQAQIAAECSEQSEGAYSIEIQLLPNSASDQRQQLLRRLAGSDSSVDLMSLDPPFIPEFAQAGFLSPVPEDMVETFTEDRVESSVVASTWNDELVTVPFWANTQLLWYRKSVAEAAGLNIEGGNVTWQQIVEAADAQDVTIGVQANRYEGYTVWINALIAGAGGEILVNPGPDLDDIELGLDSDAGRAAADIVRSVADAGVGGPSMGTSDETVSLNLFQDPDTSGFLVNWPYVWAAFPANNVDFIDDIGWAMYPATSDEGDPAPPYGGISIGVGAFTEDPDLAYQAAECITNHEHQVLYMTGTGNPASRAAVFDEAEVIDQFPMADVIRDSLEVAVPRPQTQFYGDLSTAIQREWSPPGAVTEDTPASSADLIMAVLRGEALL